MVPALLTAGGLDMFLQESELFVESEMPLHCAQYLQPVGKGERRMGKELKADRKEAMKNWFLPLP